MYPKSSLNRWSCWPTLASTSLNSTRLQYVASDRSLAVNTASQHRPQQLRRRRGKSDTGRPAQSILRLERNDQADPDTPQPHLTHAHTNPSMPHDHLLVVPVFSGPLHRRNNFLTSAGLTFTNIDSKYRLQEIAFFTQTVLVTVILIWWLMGRTAEHMEILTW